METQRLLIRRFTPEDWPGLYAYLSDEAVVKYEPYGPLTEGECRELARRHAASKDFWAVCLRRGGGLVGNVYLAEKEQQGWELGYVFARAHQGRGYATEAVTALLDDAFARQNAHRVFAQCNPENAPSWRLLERVGFRREGRLVRNIYFQSDESGAPLWQDTYLYGLLAEEWNKNGQMAKDAQGVPLQGGTS